MSLRILVVEDEKSVSQLLARILRPPRFEVIQTLTAEEARQHLTPPPNLIILDLGLPGESGEEFCHSVHRDPLTHKVPILVLTGRDTPDLAETSVAACSQELVHKPFDASELVFYVETLLKKAVYELRHYPSVSSVKENF